MEVFFLCSLSPLLLITFFIIICVSLATIFNRNNKLYKSNNSNNNLPPGKMGLPYIGESLEFLNSGRKGFPEKFIYDRMAKYSSQVFKTSILGEPTVVVCGAIANKFLFSNENKLVQAWWPDSVNKIFPSSTQTSSKEEAKKMRKLLPNFLKPEALMRYVGMMDSIAQKHFESGWEGKQQVTVFALAKRFTFSVACKVFLSIEDSQHVAKLAVPFDALASGIISVPIDLPGTPFNRAIKASKFIRKELIAVIKQRKTELAAAAASSTTPAHHHHHQDILSHMLLAADENGQHMSELDVADKILGLLIGGHDTASAAITFIVKYLAELPHIYKQVLNANGDSEEEREGEKLLNWEDIQKMKYSWNVACEVMRLAPPLQGSFREALNDFVFSGFTIPKGWKLYWSVNSTHRNPECFVEPEKFDPTRFQGRGPAPYTYVPFGGGPRMCPGKEYARLEILVFIHNIVRRFSWLQILPHEKIIVDPLPMPAHGLPVRLFPR